LLEPDRDVAMARGMPQELDNNAEADVDAVGRSLI